RARGGARRARGERARDGADRALFTDRRERGEDARETDRIFDAILLQPIGSIDVLFDARAVELSKREAVDGEDVEIFFAQKFGEAFQLVAGLGVARGARGQAQADPEALPGGDLFSHLEQTRRQRLLDFGPGLTGVDVRTVAEVQPAELHVSVAPASAPR